MTPPTTDGAAVLDTANNAGLSPAEATTLIVIDAIAQRGYPTPLRVVASTLGVQAARRAMPLRMLVRRGLVKRTHLDLGPGRIRAFTTTPNGAYLAAAFRLAGGVRA